MIFKRAVQRYGRTPEPKTPYQRAGQAIRESTQQNVSRAGDQLTSRNLNIQPTITIRPGAIVRLVVHKDLILAPWRG